MCCARGIGEGASVLGVAKTRRGHSEVWCVARAGRADSHGGEAIASRGRNTSKARPCPGLKVVRAHAWVLGFPRLHAAVPAEWPRQPWARRDKAVLWQRGSL